METKSFLDLNFLPIVVDNDTVEALSHAIPENRYRYDPSCKDRERVAVHDLYVVYEEADSEEIPVTVGEIDLTALNLSDASSEPIESVSENTRQSADSPDREDKSETPENKAGEPVLNFRLKPLFFDNFEESLIRTLDDLEELGDEREIPLLLEYLEHQKNELIRERIHVLLKKFVQWEHKAKKNRVVPTETEKFLPDYNVVRELFNSCDREAKIILLDSIVGVMDGQDMGFLKEIQDHPDPEIRKKAQLGLHRLTERLRLGNEKDRTLGTEGDGPFDLGIKIVREKKAPQAPRGTSVFGAIRRICCTIRQRLRF